MKRLRCTYLAGGVERVDELDVEDAENTLLARDVGELFEITTTAGTQLRLYPQRDGAFLIEVIDSISKAATLAEKDVALPLLRSAFDGGDLFGALDRSGVIVMRTSLR